MDVIPFCEIWVEGTGKEAGMSFPFQVLLALLTCSVKTIRKSSLFLGRSEFPFTLRT